MRAAHITAAVAFMVIAFAFNGIALIVASVLTILAWSLAIILLDVEVDPYDIPSALDKLDHRG